MGDAGDPSEFLAGVDSLPFRRILRNGPVVALHEVRDLILLRLGGNQRLQLQRQFRTLVRREIAPAELGRIAEEDERRRQGARAERRKPKDTHPLAGTRLVREWNGQRHEVSFVSVTQQFNTTTSMGRLTLNILLSFAQFEREIIGERIRDKVAATKRKGKYCGGMPVLGYDADRERKRLVVNSEEAEVVRHVFNRFVRDGSTTEIARELNAAGLTTKSWVTKHGSLHAGTPWHKMHVYRVLNNPVYIGEVTHKGTHYPGEHEAIVPRPLWDQAHGILARNHRARGGETRIKQPALLRGILKCGHCHCSMGPTYTNRHSRMYRYYHCAHAAKHGPDSCPTRTLAAGEIEGAVIEHLRGVFRTPELVAATFRAAQEQMTQHLEQLTRRRTDADLTLQMLKEEAARLMASETSLPVSTRLGELRGLMEEQELALYHLRGEIETATAASFTEREVIEALSALDPVWEQLFPGEQARIVKLLVDRVEVHPQGAEIHIRADGMRSLVDELRDDASARTKELSR